MTKQLMFYEKVAPVSVERHKAWSLTQGSDYSFASGSNAAPLMCAEFASAATELPIVFGKGDNGYAPVVVLGIEQGKSLLIDGKGKWKGAYVPAFIRRYPFVFAAGEDGQTFTLCLDEAYKGCDPKGKKGDKLYGDDDQPSETLNKALEFTKNYEIEARRTSEFCKLLDEAGLLDPMQAGIKMPNGETRAVTGFHVVSRERLKELDTDKVADFFKRDVLELIYYHLVSMRNMEKLRDLAS
ncbi:MAG: SapC family protein [Paracoccaceae bacterium]